jgi:GTP:adenosylcobinamide-phosphate guanylyltransferase
MDAIVLAGGNSENEPLAELAAGKPKSLMSIAGKPMVQWVVDAISGSRSIDTVVLIGIEKKSGISSSKPIHFLPDAGSLIENIQQGASYLNSLHPDQTHVISVSADIPAITPQIVDALVEIYEKGEADIYYGVVERNVMEKRYPGSKRTYIKVKDCEICGGDLNAYSKNAALSPDAIWKDLIRSRKNPIKQAGLIGIGSLILLLLHAVTLDKMASRVCKKLGITGKVIRIPFAEVGMDVDKPFQFEIVQADLMR